MGKLIDADDLKRDLINKWNYPALIKARIESAPEAVVRCKNCDWYKPHQRSVHWNNKACLCTRSALIKVFPDDYCSYGKRRNEE